jgi:hypothetical protein
MLKGPENSRIRPWRVAGISLALLGPAGGAASSITRASDRKTDRLSGFVNVTEKMGILVATGYPQDWQGQGGGRGDRAARRGEH